MIDLLGRERTGIIDWLEAEEWLEDLGIGYLADPDEIRRENGEWLRVRVVEMSTHEIRVKKEDWGDMTAPQVYYTVPFPVGDVMRAIDLKQKNP